MGNACPKVLPIFGGSRGLCALRCLLKSRAGHAKFMKAEFMPRALTIETMTSNILSFIPLSGMPEVTAETDLPELLEKALGEVGGVQPGDILVITHKIISKATGQVRDLRMVEPSDEAKRIADVSGKDARTVQVIMDSSEKLYVCERGLLISERRDGWICCNAGVDASNAGGEDRVILLPEDCDAQAKRISQALAEKELCLPVMICDTHGRALRSGAAGVVVGSYGMQTIRPYIGLEDRDGRVMRSTMEAVGDEIAGAATLVMGQGNEGIPAVLVRGFSYTPSTEDSAALRLPTQDRLYQIGEEKLRL